MGVHRITGTTPSITLQAPEAVDVARDAFGFVHDIDLSSISFGDDSYALYAADGSVDVSLIRTGQFAGTVTATLALSSATPTITFSPTQTTWAEGEGGSKNITLILTQPISGDYTLTLSFSEITGAQAGDPDEATLFVYPIMPGELQFASATYAFADTDGTVSVYAERIGGADGAVSATVAVVGGTAVEGVDFNLLTQSVSWSNVDAENKEILVEILDPTAAESSDGFTLFSGQDYDSGSAILSNSDRTGSIPPSDDSVYGDVISKVSLDMEDVSWDTAAFEFTTEHTSSDAVYISGGIEQSNRSDYSSVNVNPYGAVLFYYYLDGESQQRLNIAESVETPFSYNTIYDDACPWATPTHRALFLVERSSRKVWLVADGKVITAAGVAENTVTPTNYTALLSTTRRYLWADVYMENDNILDYPYTISATLNQAAATIETIIPDGFEAWL